MSIVNMCPATAAARHAALSSPKAKQYQQFGPMLDSLFSPELEVYCSILKPVHQLFFPPQLSQLLNNVRNSWDFGSRWLELSEKIGHMAMEGETEL